MAAALWEIRVALQWKPLVLFGEELSMQVLKQIVEV